MTRISSRPLTRPAADRTPAVKAETKKLLKSAFEGLAKSKLTFKDPPKGGSFARVALQAARGKAPGFAALIPTTGEKGKALDPNKAGGFFLERSGPGGKKVAGPFTFEGKPMAKPFFERFLEGQQRPGGGVQTMRYPSDNEGTTPTPKPPGGGMQTMRYPSDNEGMEPGTPKPPPGGATTLRYPSDQEGMEPGTPKPPPGGATTLRYPSDQEGMEPGTPKPPPGGATTLRYPSDQEGTTPSTPKPPGGGMQTMRYPSDQEGVEPGTPKPPGGGMQTMRYPSDNEDGNVR